MDILNYTSRNQKIVFSLGLLILSFLLMYLLLLNFKSWLLGQTNFGIVILLFAFCMMSFFSSNKLRNKIDDEDSHPKKDFDTSNLEANQPLFYSHISEINK